MDIITYALCKKAIQKSIETLGDIFTLKGNVSSTSGLPSSGNNPGDIYLVGPAQDGSYDEYYWTSEGAWEVMGSTKADFDGVITENDLYKGEDGTGTIENPAEGTILDIVKDMDSYVAGDNIDISNNIISVLGDTIKKVTTSTFNISTAAAGIYQLPQGCKINSDASYTTISTSILIVDSKSGSMVDKAWYLFDGSTGNGRRIVYGYLQGSVGSYVQTTLDQLERNTLKVNSLSSSSTIQQYPSAKCVYDNLQLKANNTTFIGTDGTTEGEKGLVPAPTSQDSNKYLKSDGTWATVSGSGTTDYSELSNKPSINNVTLTGNKTSADLGLDMVILSYGNSTWQDFLNAYRRNAVVYCRASSGSDPATGSQTRLAFIAYVNNATNPTEVEFQYYRSVSTKSASNQGDQVYVYKLTSTGEWTVQTRNAYTKIETGTNMTSSYSNGVLTLNATGGGSSYTAGDYINITNNEISVDGIATKYSTITNLTPIINKAVYGLIGDEINIMDYEDMEYFTYTNPGLTQVFHFEYKGFGGTEENEVVITDDVDCVVAVYELDYHEPAVDEYPIELRYNIPTHGKIYFNSSMNRDSYVKLLSNPSGELSNYIRVDDIFGGTDGATVGMNGLVPAPTPQDTDKFLKSDGTWGTPGADGFVNKSGDTMTGTLTVPTLSVGNNNTVSSGCVGEGDHVQAMNMNSHAEGYYTHAYGKNSHAEGDYSTASGEDAHAEGYTTVAQARYSHAEGNSTDALSQSQHVQGEWNVQDHSGTASTRGTYAHIVGNGTHESARSNAHTLDWSGNAWFAGDVYVGSTSGTDKDSGSKKLATDDTFGGTNGTNAGTKGLVPAPTASDTDKYLKSDGTWATVSGGSGNYVSKTGDTMTGTLITPNLVVGSQKSGTTLGTKATILGNEGSSLGNYSTVEGSNCVAKDDACHAEGYKCIAGAGQNGGDYSHAEGCNTTASGFCSHSEGYYTTASEYYTHAEGEKTVAAGTHSHAEGYGTKANRGFTHVQGIYNILDDTGAGDTKGTYAHIVGNGSADNNRKNIHTIKWTGEAWFQGDVYVGSTGGKNKDEGSKKLATEEYVRNLLQEFATLNNLNMPD